MKTRIHNVHEVSIVKRYQAKRSLLPALFWSLSLGRRKQSMYREGLFKRVRDGIGQLLQLPWSGCQALYREKAMSSFCK